MGRYVPYVGLEIETIQQLTEILQSVLNNFEQGRYNKWGGAFNFRFRIIPAVVNNHSGHIY